MKLSLSKEEINKVFLDVLCNGAIGFLAQSDVEMTYSDEDYQKVRENGDCYEDVLLKIINTGGKLEFVDTEGDESKTLTLEVLTKALTNIENQDFADYVLTLLKEEGDAEIGLCVLQYILYDDVIFG